MDVLRTPAERTGDEGMTLVELLIAMMVTTILLAGVGTVFTGAMRGLSSVNYRAEMLGTGETAMQTITDRLRATDYPPPQSANPSAVLAASFDSVTVMAYQSNATLAASLAASINAVNPGDQLASYLTTTGMVPTQTQFAYQASASACGGRSGVVQISTPPRFFLSGEQVFAWDTGASSRCVLRTTTAPVSGTPMFMYYADCTTGTTTSTLTQITSIGLRLRASATGQTYVELLNRACLVNLQEESP